MYSSFKGKARGMGRITHLSNSVADQASQKLTSKEKHSLNTNTLAVNIMQ